MSIITSTLHVGMAHALDPSIDVNQYVRDRWDEGDGIGDGGALSVLEGSDGYLWLGTPSAVLRFDGQRFSPTGGGPSLPQFGFVRDLIEVRRDELYGAAVGGVLKMSGDRLELLGAGEGLTRLPVNALAVDEESRLWAGTGGAGVWRWDGESFVRHTDYESLDLQNEVNDLELAPDGAIWAATDAGVLMLGAEPEVFGADSGLPSPVANTLRFDRDGRLWVGTRAGLVRFEGGRFEQVGPNADDVTALQHDVDGNVWIGARDGELRRFNASGLQSAVRLPAAGGVTALGEDSHGSLWVARAGGLERLRRGTFVTAGSEHGFESRRVLEVLPRSAGGVWVLDATGAVYVFAGGRAQKVAPSGSVRGDGLLGLAESEDGSLWVAADALQRFHGGRWQYFENPGGDFSVLAKDEFGLLVAQTRDDGVSKLSHFDGERFSEIEAARGLRRVLRILRDSRGRVWLTTGGDGVARIDGQVRRGWTTQQGLPHDVVYGITEDPRGVIWLATAGGLARLDGERVTSYAGVLGAPERSSLHVMLDGLGYLWVAADDGVHRFSLDVLDAVAAGTQAELVGERFTRNDGLHSSVISWRPGGQARTSDGRLWYATESGLSYVEPTAVGRETSPPPPLVEAVFVNGEVAQNHSLKLGSPTERIEVHFGAPALSGTDVVEYRHRLRGFGDWVPSGTRRFAHYTNLRSGDYLFEVEARRNRGPWSKPARLAMAIAPSWSDRPWVRLGLAAFALSGLFALYSLRVRQLKQREADLRQKVDARTRDLEQEIKERRQAEEQVRKLNSELEGNVKERTVQLMTVNQALIEDVQKRQAAEAQLADEKERLQVTLSSIAEGVIAVDVGGRISLMNRVAEQYTGTSSAEASGAPLTDVFVAVDRETRQPLTELVVDVLENGSASEGQLLQVLLVGQGDVPSERLVDASASPINDTADHRVGAVLVFRDVTARVRAEEQLRKTEKLESLGVLAGGIAHDFNNMLTGIFCHVDMARRTIAWDNPARRWLDDTMAVLDNAKGLARQLLTFASGGQPTLESHSLGELLRDSTRFVLSGSRVSVALEIPDDLWPCDMDPVQIRQLVDNLVLNARQAMGDVGSLRIAGANLTTAPDERHHLGSNDPYPERWVEIAIRDDGPGIAPEIVDRIFDPFFTTKATGSGLGLATVHSIATKHGGKIDVESHLGKGTTFRLRLRAATTPAVSAFPRLASDYRAALNTRTVLVMDDEYPIRRVAEAALLGAGYEVVLAESGEQAIAAYADSMAAGRMIDLVILDLTVAGGMGGAETLHKLRELNPGLAAIASSGYSAGTVLGDPKAHGFNAALPKPYTIDDLVAAVETMLRAA